MLHAIVVAVRKGGVEVYDLFGIHVPSQLESLRKARVAVSLHTSPSQCS